MEDKLEKIILKENIKERTYLEIEMNKFHPKLVDICKMILDKENGDRNLKGRLNFDIKHLPNFIIELIKLLNSELNG